MRWWPLGKVNERRGEVHHGRLRAQGTIPSIWYTNQDPTQADVAQLVEQPIRNRQVSGSSPLVGSRFHAGSEDITLGTRFVLSHFFIP